MGDEWSPCRGGVDSSEDGNALCHPFYEGPKCEVCTNTTENGIRYFLNSKARCQPCDRPAESVMLLVGLLFSLTSSASTNAVGWVKEHRNTALLLITLILAWRIMYVFVFSENPLWPLPCEVPPAGVSQDD